MGNPAKPLPSYQRPATYQDILNAPENMIAELVNVELSLMPRPRKRHVRVSSKLGSFLDGSFDRDDGDINGWVILDEPEIHFGDVKNPSADTLVPDLAGWHRDRFHESLDGAYFITPPQWVCEILSPATATYDRTIKQPVYLREKVDYIWYIDPENQSLEVLEKQGSHYLILDIFRGETKVRAKPFDALELNLTRLWTL